jgi:hypothetical protein
MHETPLLHKPVVYGSELADLAFIALVAAHALLGAAAFVSSIAALVARKGQRAHLRAGAIFVRAMVATALTGIVVDGIRLAAVFDANHTKYAHLGMPSTIPARLGFLFAALGVLYLAHVGGRRDFAQRARRPADLVDRTVPPALVLIGVALVALIVAKLNPWTGALWMIVTFLAAVIVAARERVFGARDHASAVRQHRFAMLVLAGFSWWGAAQGFGPALAIALRGIEPSTTPYTGASPGPFSPQIFLFLVGWAPAFAIAGALLVRFARRAARAAPSA